MTDQILNDIAAVSSVTPRNVFILGGVIAASIWLLDFILSPRLDPDEPPLIKPTIPLIGHIIGLLWHQNGYHRVLKKKHPNVPIASLQMLWGKIYAVWDPDLAQAALRSKGPSFEPLMLLYAKAMMGATDETVQKIKSQKDKLIPTFFDVIHGSMGSSNVQKMNKQAWEVTGKTFDDIETLEGPNMYDWVRTLITLATTKALFGEHDPFQKDPSQVQYVWDWEAQLSDLVTRPLPWLTARKGYLARHNLQTMSKAYYEAEHYLTDPSVSKLVRDRATTLRDFGFTSEEIGQLEAVLPIAGATNSAPTTYWFICYIFGRPDLAAKLREEITPLVTVKDGVATIEITQIEARCPLLVSCYKETIRLRNSNVSPRMMISDTTISDGQGRQYLLKKDTDVQIVSVIAQQMEEVWGPDAKEFDPTRFLPTTTTDKEARRVEKTKDRAFIPFGGGRHLCPGQAFGFAEIMSVTVTLLVGFEVEATGIGFNDVQAGVLKLGSSTLKPAREGEGTAFRLARRKGWEGVKWRYV